jgi:hypothetical protein
VNRRRISGERFPGITLLDPRWNSVEVQCGWTFQ